MNRRNLAWPVSMNSIMGRGGPLQGVRTPWVLGGILSSVNTIEEVEEEEDLSYGTRNGKYGD